MIIHALIKDLSLDIIETLVERNGVSVFHAVKNGRSVLLKVHSSETKFTQETDSLQRVHSKSVPVPAILATKKIVDRYIFLQEWWEGITLDKVFHELNRLHQTELLHGIGQLLAKVHKSLSPTELEQSVLGRTNAASTSTKKSSWKEYYHDQYHRWINQLKLQIFAD